MQVLAAEPLDPIAFVRDVASEAMRRRAPDAAGYLPTAPDRLFEATILAVSQNKHTLG